MEETRSSHGEDFDMNDETEERTLLLESTENQQKLSTTRQRAMLAVVTFLRFCGLLPDTTVYPFYPHVAAGKGLTGLQIGVVFAAFDFSMFIAAPIVGSMVCTCILNLLFC